MVSPQPASVESRPLRRVLAACLLGLAACGPPGSPPAAEAATPRVPRMIPRNLVLVSIDTLRADRLGTYGHARDTSPRIDALAAAGVVFENAVAESSWTLPSHATMLTGLHPLRHGVLRKGQKLEAAHTLLAERLAAFGFRCAGFTGAGYMTAARGFDQGFATFKASMVGRHLTKEGLGRWSREALAHVDAAGDERFFVFLHAYAAHCPYTPPEPYDAWFRSPDAEPFDLSRMCEADFAQLQPGPGQLLHVRDHYDDCVRWADAELGEFLDALATRGLLADTLVVVTSDHGEELGEAGTIGHGHALRPEVLRVPLVFAGPGIEPLRSTAVVGLADVVPTLLELLGLPAAAGLDGTSLVPLMEPESGPTDEGRLAWLELDSKQRSARSAAWIQGPYQLVVDQLDGTLELFEVGRDPSQARARATAEPELTALLRSRMEAALASFEPGGPGSAAEIGAQELQRLRELGYAGD